jgi:hypothetical protein
VYVQLLFPRQGYLDGSTHIGLRDVIPAVPSGTIGIGLPLHGIAFVPRAVENPLVPRHFDPRREIRNGERSRWGIGTIVEEAGQPPAKGQLDLAQCGNFGLGSKRDVHILNRGDPPADGLSGIALAVGGIALPEPA